jgi:hypothetical protein
MTPDEIRETVRDLQREVAGLRSALSWKDLTDNDLHNAKMHVGWARQKLDQIEGFIQQRREEA